jgi:hypothetical protein
MLRYERRTEALRPFCYRLSRLTALVAGEDCPG